MSYPTGQQTSAVWTLVSPAGTRAVWNDPYDPDYVGVLNGEEAVTGLDSPEIRSSLHSRVEADGALAGFFYLDHRPITMQGTINTATIVERNTRETRLKQAVFECLRADGTLTWTPAGGISHYVKVRAYQPLRIKGGFAKNFFVSLVAPDPRIYSTTLSSISSDYNTDNTVTNEGSAPSEPVLLRATGPGTTPQFRRTWGGVVLDINLTGLTLLGGEYVDLDVRNKTATKNDGTNLYQYVNFASSSWWSLGPGSNTVRLNWTSGATTASDLRIDWRHAWL